MPSQHGPFYQAGRLHDVAVSIVANALKITKRRGLDRKVVDTALGVYVKACKQFRSVQLLVEAGLTEDAQGIDNKSRETMIALYFLLRHRVELKLPAIPGKPLSTKFRADLYLAHGVLQKDKMLNDWGQTKGLKRHYKKVLLGDFPRTVEAVKTMLGPDWTKRVRDGNYYSGTKIGELIKSFRVPVLYAVQLRMGSQFVHPTDIDSYLTIKNGRTVLYLQPHDQWLKETVMTAKMLLCLSMDVLNDRLGLGYDVRIIRQKRAIGLTT